MRPTLRPAIAFLMLVGAAASSAGTSGQSLFTFEPVLMTGQPAPGLEPALVDEIGVYQDIFNPDPFSGGPQIGPAGAVAIGAQVGGDGLPGTRDGSSNAVWRAVGGALTLAAAAGDPAPGTPLLFANMFSPFEHDDGVVFAAAVTEASTGDRFGLWSLRGGALRKLLLQGEPIPGVPAGGTMFQFAFVARGAAVLVESNWCQPDGGCAPWNEGLFRDRSGALAPVVIRGMPAPGIAGGVFDEFPVTVRTGPVDRWNASESGRVIFNGHVRGRRVKPTSDEGVWMETAAGLVLLAREGTNVPGAKGWKWGSGTGHRSFGDFTVMGTPQLSANGLALWGASITSRQYNRVGGVWSTRTGEVRQIVQTAPQFGITDEPPLSLSTPAPGFAAGFYVSRAFSGRINSAGEVYLDVDVVHELDPQSPIPAILRVPPGSQAPQLFAHVGGSLGAVPGASLVGIDLGRLYETGHYLWTARIAGPGITAANDRVALLTAPGGSTSVVLRTGSVLEGRTVARFGVPTDPRGGGQTLRQVFEVHFTDGSAGVFIGGLP